MFLFAALFYAGEFLLFNLMSARISSSGRKVLNQMYMSNSIEAGFFGGSQILYGVDCDVAGEKFGKSIANLTSSQQPLTATDAVLRETSAHYPEMKTAYVSLDYSLVMAEEVNLESIYIVSDALKPSWNKIRYLLHATPQEYYLNSFFPLKKERDILKDSGVTYLDYNDSSFERNRADYFFDDCHLSGLGASEFTSVLCTDLINADMEETE